jgi:peptidoglycan/LPS O-acetylase OafA/YrhL
LKQERLGYLDSARGLAAMCVLLVHAIASFSETNFELVSIANFTKEYLDLGKVFLILFFLTSGFVIPFSIKGKGANALKSFGISRFFRLYPVYWVSAILGFVLYGTFTYTDLLFNLTMFQQFFGVENIIGLYWTLQIELIFYFLVALTFMGNRLFNKKFLFQVSVLFLLLALGMAIVRNVLLIKLPLAVPLTLSIMYFGAFFRYYVLDKDALAKKLSRYYFLIYLILIPVISYIGYNHDFGYNESWDKYTLTYFLGLLVFVGICQFKFTSKAMEYSGKISYSVYVFHPLTILVIQQMTFFDSVNGFLKVGLVLVATMLFSHVTYYLIESPSISFGRKLRKRLVKG